jgi:drug/metabolite transporter (DMT)-like permease
MSRDPGRLRQRFIARCALAGSAFSFGLMAVLARRLSQPDLGFRAGQLAVLRFAVGILACLAAFRLRPGLYRPRNYPMLLSRGITGGLVVILYFHALARIPAGEAGVLYNLFPVLATVMSLRAFHERPTPHLLLAILAASAGVVLVLGQGHFAFSLGLGELAALAAAFFAATSAIAIRAARPYTNSMTIFFFFSLVGLPVVAPFAFGPWPHGMQAWLLGLLMSLMALAAQVLMAEAYGTLSISEAAVWLQLTPIANYLLALPLLGERLRPSGLAGVLLTVAGVAYATALGARAAGPAPERP